MTLQWGNYLVISISLLILVWKIGALTMSFFLLLK